MIVAGKDQLQGWKEIASFLGRDERTAKRWEKQRGLPVRRIPGTGRANVYALVAELEGWLAEDRVPEQADAGELPDAVDVLEVLDFSAAQAPMPYPAAALTAPAVGSASGLTVPQPEDTLNASAETTRAPRRGRIFLVTLAAVLALSAAAAGFSLSRQQQAARAIQDGAMSSAAAPAANRPYRSPQAGADELYLQGVYLYEERTPESLNSARQAFEQSIRTDPNHAPSYAGLAETYLMLREYATMPSDAAYLKAQQAAEHAVALDPDLPDAHACLGFIDFFSLWKPKEARTEFETALRLQPNSALAHHWFGSMLTHQGLLPEALTQLNLAQRLQPTSAAILASRAFALGMSGDRAAAEKMLRALIKFDPSAASPHRTLALVAIMAPADYPTYLQENSQFADLRRDSYGQQSQRLASAAYARGGPRAMWQAMLQHEQQAHPDPQHPSYRLAEAQACLQQDDAAVQTLTQLVRLHSDEALGLRIDPAFVSLRGRPDFQKLLRTVGLPD